MTNRLIRILAVIAALLVMVTTVALADNTISTTVVMRVSRMTQNAVVNAGEDLSMEVNIDGVTPASYQWYLEGAPISGATQKVYNIVNASLDDAGIYRLDAFDSDGKMLVSMDISARVVDNTVPKSGDASMPLNVVYMAMGLAAAAMLLLRRRAEA